MTIQVKAIEQYFPAVLFVLLYSVVLTFEPLHETPNSDHSSESYPAVLSFGTDPSDVTTHSNNIYWQYFALVLFFLLHSVALIISG